MALDPVSEDDLALLQRLYSDPLVSGEHEWHGWQDTRWLRREWEENGLLGEDRGTLMARKGDDTLGFVGRLYPGRGVARRPVPPRPIA
jgi:hypothetical protein